MSLRGFIEKIRSGARFNPKEDFRVVFCSFSCALFELLNHYTIYYIHICVSGQTRYIFHATFIYNLNQSIGRNFGRYLSFFNFIGFDNYFMKQENYHKFIKKLVKHDTIEKMR